MRHLYSITIVSDEVDGVLNRLVLEGLLCKILSSYGVIMSGNEKCHGSSPPNSRKMPKINRHDRNK